MVDANNHPTTVRYDALGRTDRVWYADRLTSLSPSLQFSYRVVEGQPVAVGTTRLGNNNGNLRDTGYTLYDGLLRPRQTQEPGPDGGRLLTDTFHDERGLVSRTFGTYYTTGAPSSTLFLPDDADSVETQTRHTYDGVGRDIRTQVLGGNSDGAKVLATTETTHFGDRVTVVPPDGATVTTSLSDARGRLTELRQHHGRNAASEYDTTSYTYTPTDQIAGVTTPSGATWEYRYDQQGQRTASIDPDTGTTTSTYSDRGELVTTTNARGITLHRSYDGLGRQTELREENAEGRLRAQWEYDTAQRGKGQLSRATRWEDGEAYVNEVVAYDPRYRAVRSRTIIPGAEGALAGTYETRQDYSPAGLVRGVSYPAAGGLPAHGVSYTYENGTLRPIRAFEQGGLTATTAYSHTGKPLQFAMHRDAADTVWATNTYEWGTQRLQTTRVDRRDQPGVDRRETYSYDGAGNVLSIADTSRTGADVQCFTYDHLRRLTGAWAQSRTGCATDGGAADIGGPSPYHHAYTYDEAGNRTTETLHEQDITRTYSYDEDQPHTLTEVVQEAPGVRSLEEYGYDESGNTVSRQVGGKTQTLEWNPEGRVASVEDADGTTVEYLYDADGSRLIGRTGTETTLYLGHTEVTVANGGTTPTAERYLPMGGGHTAVIDSDGTTSFVMADHHGTGNLAIDAESLETTHRRTLPFGAYRDDVPEEQWPGTRTFVGGTDDVSTGLYNIGAREYDAAIGRFISADPVMDLTDPQQIHGYAYANNNPLAYSDPTGLFLNGVINRVHRIVQTIIKKVIKHASSAMRTAKHKVAPPRRPVISRFSSKPRPIQRSSTQQRTATRASYSSGGGISQASTNTSCPNSRLCMSWLGPAIEESTKRTLNWIGKGGRKAEEIAAAAAGIDDAITCANDPGLTSACGWTLAGIFPAGRILDLMGSAVPGVARLSKACSSFVPGTHVLMANGTTKAIEDVRVGDEVLATDPETGETSARTVTAELTSHGDKLLVTVSVLDGNGNPQQLIATDNHPLWLPAIQQWIDAAELEPGTQLYANDGTLVDVTAVTTNTTATTVHNLTIEGIHTYYVLVGEIPVLVHNSTCGPDLSINEGQFGKKWGKHAQDYNLNPGDASSRKWFRDRIAEVRTSPDEVRQGPWNPTRGGGEGYFFYRQGDDLLVTKSDGQFVTMFPMESPNKWFQQATPNP
ncbi:polymorphic toxin-type HINT domain-containing protein [Streptomyces otsuchiensis]|uniref:polymorphic toxin-type HINT domain-containing protein n=1 Tax=Streptomyces otsuchiensis TaxID=2681388 RepID=UPI001476CC54|nr:polymorphic toxin-type HINT domain-containing protein [Streptomyces otsuchiensis]